ncbi:hypothetical protein [Kitasatospora sp. NE20-6]
MVLTLADVQAKEDVHQITKPSGCFGRLFYPTLDPGTGRWPG